MFLAQFLVEKNIFHERLGFNFFPAKLRQAKSVTNTLPEARTLAERNSR